MKQYANILVALLVAILLTGCGSTKRAATSSSGHQRRPAPTHVPVSSSLPHPTKALLSEIDGWLGVPYKYAGEDKSGVDCSALIMKVYNSALGIKIPRNSAKQQEFCSSVSRSKLNPGDLVFFSNSSGKVNHVGMYIGDDNIVHASSSRGVIISSLSENYYVKNFHSAGRVDQYFAMLRKANTPAKSVNLEPTAPEPPLQASTAKANPAPSSAPTPIATIPASALESVHFSAATLPPATAAAIDEARRKVLDEVVEQKADSILSQFFE